MSDNNDVNSANGQYSNPPFGMGSVDNTGMPGTDGGQVTNGQYNADPAYSSTGAPGSDPANPPRDGGSTEVTSPFGYLDGSDAPLVSGPTNTSKNSLTGIEVPVDFGGPDFDGNSTNAGRGEVGGNRVTG